MPTDLVNVRERAMHAHITAVENAAKEWAKHSTDGALIWQVATECLDDVWAEWRHASTYERWSPHGVVRALNSLSSAIGDAAVAAAVTAAVGAIAAYAEPQGSRSEET